MKQIVKIIDSNVIDVDKLPTKGFLGMIADHDKKYLLSIGEAGGFCFRRNGGIFWSENENHSALIRHIVGDSRCKVFYFETMEELARWILI